MAETKFACFIELCGQATFGTAQAKKYSPEIPTEHGSRQTGGI
jgi:hypothetical protein